jgi:hypothetical protein
MGSSSGIVRNYGSVCGLHRAAIGLQLLRNRDDQAAGTVRHFDVVSGFAAGVEGAGLAAALSPLLGAFGSDFASDFASGFVSDADSAADELLFEA